MKTRRTQNLAPIALACMVVFVTIAAQGADPFFSWNDGPAKQAIVEFVKATTTQGSPQLVPPEERIATFDQDGTLWVEHPMYSQVMYCLERFRRWSRRSRNWPRSRRSAPCLKYSTATAPRWRSSRWNDLMKIARRHAHRHVDRAVSGRSEDLAGRSKDPRWKKPYTELTYLPMQEVLKYLRANGYKTYIVTGGGQDFVRQYSEETYGIPPEQVVGSAGETKYGYDKDGKPFLTKEPKMLLNDNNAGKPEGIHLMIGRRPYAAFGNSSGDQQMLEYTKAGSGARLAMLVLHDDAENANTPTARCKGCPTRKSARSRRRSMTKRKRTAGPSSA